jgi:hypothetical protein
MTVSRTKENDKGQLQGAMTMTKKNIASAGAAAASLADTKTRRHERGNEFLGRHEDTKAQEIPRKAREHEDRRHEDTKTRDFLGRHEDEKTRDFLGSHEDAKTSSEDTKTRRHEDTSFS